MRQMATDEIKEWPCQTPPQETVPVRLVAALYLLLRDHVHPGDMEDTLLKVADYDADSVIGYTNPHLEALARAHATFLLNATRENVRSDESGKLSHE
jgi:hypothetical protein